MRAISWRLRRREVLGALGGMLLPGCGRRADDSRALTLVHQPLGDRAAFDALLNAFRAEHPEVPLVTRLVPSSSDALHQYLLTALEGRAELDVLVADVVWIAEFTRAGWIADLSAELPPEDVRRDHVPAATEVAVVEGRTRAVPWWIDVGVLYTRTDLVEAPRTFDGVIRASERARTLGLAGYLFQGRQYEGLVCNAYEAIWGHGGATASGSRLALDTREARDALGFLASLVERGLAPAMVTSAAEEECRRMFQDGRAALLRSWPYVWTEVNRADSKIRDRVSIGAVPTLSGEPGHGALGGWFLAVAAHVPAWKRKLATDLALHLASDASQIALARAYGRLPSRRAAWDALRADSPVSDSVLDRLAAIVEHARPRPTTAWYPMISDVLQGELSAIISQVRSPAEGLSRAQRLCDRVMGAS